MSDDKDPAGIRAAVAALDARRAETLAQKWGKRQSMRDFPCGSSDDELRCMEGCDWERSCEFASIYRELLTHQGVIPTAAKTYA